MAELREGYAALGGARGEQGHRLGDESGAALDDRRLGRIGFGLSGFAPGSFGVARTRSGAGSATYVTARTSFVAAHTSFNDASTCLDGACTSFVGASASCCGPPTNDVPAPTSFVDGSAHDVDAPTYDHDSFESNVVAST